VKFSISSSFTRLTLVLFVSVLLLTVAGRATLLTGAAFACVGWPLCVPVGAFGWIKLLHMALVGLSIIFMVWLFIKAWREQRDDRVLLPLTTVTTILFFGQAFVGALDVAQNFPLHLVVLHDFTAIALWISLITLMATSALLARDGKVFPEATFRNRISDFFVLSKPLIVALLLVTTFGGLVMGGRAWPSPILAFWTLLGGALAAGGSSALNQYIDRELDKNMQRTSKRPLATGRLTAAEGLAYGLGLCLTSYYILAGFVNLTAALLSLAGIFYYVIFYSVWLKKATVQNIVIGGGAGAIPPMVGWAAAAGHLSLAAWILFLIIFMWTPPHFWALAIVRKKDYENAGVPMLPVIKGERETRLQILIYTFVLVGTTMLLPIIKATGIIYLVSASLLGLWLIYGAWRVWTVPGNKVAFMMYRWTSMYLMFIFIALVIDAVV
jgi:protoheme IX farnesyltransferase